MRLTINGHLCLSPEDVRQYASQGVYEFVKEFTDEQPYVQAHTSGSTGEPKPVRLLKADMLASAALTNGFFKLDAGSLFYLNLSPDYIAGKMMIVRALALGAEIVEEKPSNTPMADYDSNRHISLAAFVPSQVVYLLNNPEKLALIDAMIIGGGRLAPRWEHWLAEMGANAYRTYGMTETCSHVALAPVGKIELPFKALGRVSFACDDDDCLIINAPHLSVGQLRTRDVAELVNEHCFYLRGRADNVINTGAIKVYPEEIEQKLTPLLPNIRFFITSQPSEKWGEEVVLAMEYSSLPEGVVRRGEVQPALVEKMKTLLPPYAVPRKYVAVKRFSLTGSGKIIRKI